MVKLSHGRYYYDFLNAVERLRKEDDSCFICGSSHNVKPHHILRVKDSDKRYAALSNIVLLCDHHHSKFHQLYGSGKGVNHKNFTIFCKKEYLKQINQLVKKNHELQDYKDNVVHVVDYAVKHERTDLGSNVLRQLAVNLEIEVD